MYLVENGSFRELGHKDPWTFSCECVFVRSFQRYVSMPLKQGSA